MTWARILAARVPPREVPPSCPAGALRPSLRPVVAVAHGVGWILLRHGHRPRAVAWAATLPIAVALVWPWIDGADMALVGGLACRSAG